MTRSAKPPKGYELTRGIPSVPGDRYICIVDHDCIYGVRRWRRVDKNHAWCGEASGVGGFQFARRIARPARAKRRGR